MANDSSTGGYLVPGAGAPVLEDDDLARALQAAVVGITGLDGTLVRPRWQAVVPRNPPIDVNWCAIGLVTETPDDNASVTHVADNPDGTGHDVLVRHTLLEVLASFYGPAAAGYAAQLRDGLTISQNQEALAGDGIAFIDCGVLTPAPELVNQQWLRRVDLPVRLRRAVSRTYPVLNLLSAPTPIET